MGFGFLAFIIKVIAYFIIHIILGIIVNNLHKSMYEKGSLLAWIPFTNLYLLGRLTFNETVSYVLIGGIILSQIPFGKNAYGTPRKLPISGWIILLDVLLVSFAIAKAVKIKQGKLSQKTAIEKPMESLKIVASSLMDDFYNMNSDKPISNNQTNLTRNINQVSNQKEDKTSNKFIKEDSYEENSIFNNTNESISEKDNNSNRFIDESIFEENGIPKDLNTEDIVIDKEVDEESLRGYRFIDKNMIGKEEEKQTNNKKNDDEVSDLRGLYK